MLLEVELPDRPDDAGNLVGQVLIDALDLGFDDLALALEVRVVDVEVEAAPLEGLGEFAGGVRGEEHQRHLGGDDRPQFGDRHLVLGEDLEQQGLGLYLEPVDLVHQQHDGILGPDGLEQGAGEEELLGEEVVLDLGPVAFLLGLDAQELLLVVPLVEGLGLVEALVALEADQAGAGDFGDALGKFGLAGTGRALDDDRLAEAVGQVDDAGDPLVGQVLGLGQHGADGRDVFETVGHGGDRTDR